MESRSPLKPNPTKNSLVSCSKQDLLSWFTMDRPTSPRSCPLLRHLLQKSFSVAVPDVRRRQRGIPRPPGSTRLRPVDPALHLGWFPQWWTPSHLFANHDLTSEWQKWSLLRPRNRPFQDLFFFKLLTLCSSRPPSLFLFLAFLRRFSSVFSLLIVTRWVAFGSNSLSRVAPVTPVTIMDNSHCREIHYTIWLRLWCI